MHGVEFLGNFLLGECKSASEDRSDAMGFGWNEGSDDDARAFGQQHDLVSAQVDGTRNHEGLL